MKYGNVSGLLTIPLSSLEYLLDYQHVRSIIFTSGTISPMQPFITSLGISVDVVLQNSHIIDQSQVLVEIISHGPDSEELLSNYDNRLLLTHTILKRNFLNAKNLQINCEIFAFVGHNNCEVVASRTRRIANFFPILQNSEYVQERLAKQWQHLECYRTNKADFCRTTDQRRIHQDHEKLLPTN